MKTFKSITIFSLLIPLLSLLIINDTIGQDLDLKFNPYWSVNINAGPNLFYGDIENYRLYKTFENNSEWKFGYGLMIQNSLSPVLTIRGQVMSGELSGTKRKSKKWFSADIIETSLSAKVNLSNLIAGNKDRKISIYGMAGLGLSHWKTQLMDLNSNETIYSNGYTNGSGINGRTVEAVIPFGIGADVRLNDKWEVNFEASLRPVNSDLLDANEGGFQYDFYSYNFIGITYKFTKRKAVLPELPPPNVIAESPVKKEAPAEGEKIIATAEDQIEKSDRLDQQLLKVEAKENMYVETWKDVRFKVQIAASKSEDDIAKLSALFMLEENSIQVIKNDGWFTYNTGNFSKYWKAKEYCNLLVSRNQVYDAFVVAYKNENKIALEELLSDNENSQSKYLVNDRSNFFGVQILATRQNKYAVESIKSLFGLYEDIHIDNSNQLIRYIAGDFTSYVEAEKLLDTLKQKGIKDAFIVEYKNGIRQ